MENIADAIWNSDNINFIDKIFWRIGEDNGQVEIRLWLIVVLIILLFSFVSEMLTKWAGKEDKSEEFLFNGTTTSGRMLIEIGITWALLFYVVPPIFEFFVSSEYEINAKLSNYQEGD